MRNAWRSVYEFYSDYLRFDKPADLTLWEVSKNTMVSSWLNKKNILTLWKKMFFSLALAINDFENDDLDKFAQQNKEAIACLLWIFSFYCEISGVWEFEDKWLVWFKKELINHEEVTSLRLWRKKIKVLNSFLSGEKYIEFSMQMIYSLRQTMNVTQGTWKAWTEVTLFDDNKLQWSDILNMLFSSVISKYLASLWNEKVDELRKDTWAWVLWLIEKQ